MVETAPGAIESAMQWMLDCYPHEGCGLIDGDGRFVPAANLARQPGECFKIAPHLIEAHAARAVLHSHVNGWRCPSSYDMRQQRIMALPWGIIWTDGRFVEPPFFWDGQPADPTGRGFRCGVYDCINLARWELAQAGIAVADPPRDPDSRHEVANALMSAAQLVLGFNVVRGVPRPLDVVVFRYRQAASLHIGVMQADGTVRHHDGRGDHEPASLPASTPWPLMLRAYQHVITYRHRELAA